MLKQYLLIFSSFLKASKKLKQLTSLLKRTKGETIENPEGMNLLSVRDAISIIKNREKAKYSPEDMDLMTLDEAREEYKEKTIMGRKYPTYKIDLKFLIL